MYRVDHRPDPADPSLIDTKLTLENITDDKSYDRVQIRVIVDQPDVILNATVRPRQPAWEGDEAPNFSPRSATYNFPKMQPNDKFDCYITHKNKDSMHIVLIAQNSNILLTKVSFTTYLVSYHLVISLLVGSILFLLLLLLILNRSTGAEA